MNLVEQYQLRTCTEDDISTNAKVSNTKLNDPDLKKKLSVALILILR